MPPRAKASGQPKRHFRLRKRNRSAGLTSSFTSPRRNNSSTWTTDGARALSKPPRLSERALRSCLRVSRFLDFEFCNALVAGGNILAGHVDSQGGVSRFRMLVALRGGEPIPFVSFNS